MAVYLRHRVSTVYRTLVRYHVRPYTSAAQDNKDGEKRPRLDFSNTAEAFQSKSTAELLRHYLVYKSLTFNSLVDNSQKLVNILQRVFGRRFFNWFMKKWLFGQFVAGEHLECLRPVIERQHRSGVRSILDYAVEEDIGNKQEEIKMKPSARIYPYVNDDNCDKNKKNFLDCIRTAAEVAKGDNAFAAVKLTGLGRPELLECLSKMIVEIEDIFLRLADSGDILKARVTLESFQRGLAGMGVKLTPSESEKLFQEMDTGKSGKLSLSGWNDHFKPGRVMHGLFQSQKPKGYNLTAPDEQELDNMVQRAHELAQCAVEKGVCMMIDAEQTYFQPAIRHLAVNVLMPTYNKSRPVVYNTIQCYLKDAEKTLRMDLQRLSETPGLRYGVKLVRGAYMEQERKLAKEKGYEDPIWPEKEDTHACYHRLLESLLKQVEPGRLHIMVATHNEKTVQLAVDKMGQYGVDKSKGAVAFGQLLGMCDHVTFTLGQAGYHAYKYMPYGPVQDVVPYLLRRVNENRGILDGAKRERELVGREIRRRLFKRKE